MKNSLGQKYISKVDPKLPIPKILFELDITKKQTTTWLISIMRTIGFLKVWRVASGELLNVIHAHDKEINVLCATKDGQYIATASKDKTIKVWKADTLNLEATLVGHTRTWAV